MAATIATETTAMATPFFLENLEDGVFVFVGVFVFLEESVGLKINKIKIHIHIDRYTIIYFSFSSTNLLSNVHNKNTKASTVSVEIKDWYIKLSSEG